MAKREELMASLRSVKWGEFAIGELFDISRGRNFPKSDWKSGSIPIITTTGLNNGITDFISNPNDKVSKNSLTVAGTGTVGSTFYHEYEHNVGEWVLSLTLKDKDLNKHLALFLTTVISYQKDKYSYAYKLGNERLSAQKILLPVDPNGNPDWSFMENFMKEVETLVQPSMDFTEHVITDTRELDDVEWGEFEIGEMFDIRSGVRLEKKNMVDGDIPYIGATSVNNGITNYVSNVNSSLDSNVLGVNYDGSVVENFYHPYECVFSDSVKRLSLRLENSNKYHYLFCKVAILQQKEKYMYAYKFNERRMTKQKITLPVDPNGNPDWNFMEQYMKRVENNIMK